MYRILIVEDDKSISYGLQEIFSIEGYECQVASSGSIAMKRIEESKPDIIILDRGLPDIDGIELCKKVKESSRNRNIPILVLTVRGELSDKVEGLDKGADDYMTKPFEIDELRARVKALLRRFYAQDIDNITKIADMSIDFNTMVCRKGEGEVAFTKLEWNLLRYFVNRKGEVVTRKDLLENVWKVKSTDTRSIDMGITRLRQKIEDDSNSPKIILTVKGLGYKMLW